MHSYVHNDLFYSQAPTVDRCIPPITGYIVVISFNGNTLSSRVLAANVTSILLSEYYSSHPAAESLEVVYDVTVIAINDVYEYVPFYTNSTGT